MIVGSIKLNSFYKIVSPSFGIENVDIETDINVRYDVSMNKMADSGNFAVPIRRNKPKLTISDDHR